MANHPRRTQVITYTSPRGHKIDLTRGQIRRLKEAGVWPKDPAGEEYCLVSFGLHPGTPTYSGEEFDEAFAKNFSRKHVIGACRKPVPDQLRKEPIGLKLPRWLIDWLDTRSESRAVAIEQALIIVHRLRPPE